jgi:hypothetical protein
MRGASSRPQRHLSWHGFESRSLGVDNRSRREFLSKLNHLCDRRSYGNAVYDDIARLASEIEALSKEFGNSGRKVRIEWH